jgi:hypothetical protein
VEVLGEDREAAVTVEQDRVVVIALGHREHEMSISNRCAASARQYANALLVSSSGRSRNCRCVVRRVTM